MELLQLFLSQQRKDARNQRLAKEVENKKMCSSAVVTEMCDMTCDVKWLRLMVEYKEFIFKAGQWVDFVVPELDAIGGYSVASPPSLMRKNGFIELAVKYSEYPPTYWIHTQCKPSDRVQLKVGGKFHFNPKNVTIPADDVLLLAGGIGINPLHSMMSHIADVNTYPSGPYKGKILLLYSARTYCDLIWKDSLDKLYRENDNIGTIYFCSREDQDNITRLCSESENILAQYHVTRQEDIPQDIKCGRIKFQDVREAVERLDKERLKVFICGPWPFVEDMVKNLYSCGITQDKINYEKWEKNLLPLKGQKNVTPEKKL